ncbi:MAG: GTP pyrophosphokinase [Paludibacter sp.]
MQLQLEKAISIALLAHKGQIDKGGNPYILHPLRIMIGMPTIEEKIVAVLHDVLEDSNITIQNLREENYSEKILNALTLLTKNENQSYNEYISEIKKNTLATKVKLADLRDNMDKNRIINPNEKDIERMNKYIKAFKQLTT